MSGAPFDAAAWIAEARRLGYRPQTGPEGGLAIEYIDQQVPYSPDERRLWSTAHGHGDRALGRERRAAIVKALAAEVRS